jgi:membrane-bound ClpP family serine protease
MKGTLVTIGIILLVLGVIGLVANYSATWMWLLIVLGVIGVVWGWMTKPVMK